MNEQEPQTIKPEKTRPFTFLEYVSLLSPLPQNLTEEAELNPTERELTMEEYIKINPLQGQKI